MAADGLGTDFAGRRALITGGGSGIGAATAAALAAAGASVVLVGRRAEPLERLAAKLGTEHGVDALPFPADVVRPDQVNAAFRFAAAIGAPEIVVCAAGVAHAGKLENVSDDDVDRVLAVNVKGAWNVARACVPAMKAAGYGRIVHVASTAGVRGYRYNALYAASKHALCGFTRSLAAELLPSGVTVNAACPGFVDTDLVDAAARDVAEKTGRTFEEAKQVLGAQNPLGRLVTPEEVAHAILFLAAASSSAISGVSLIVDGGTPHW
ncbi:MAG TPA: SDR family oxidoreductase [Planctomycetota bacterium]|nr:SDR family oxidoreductase [Planctomycetota bacterium]